MKKKTAVVQHPKVTVAGLAPQPKNVPPQMLGPSSKSPVKKITKKGKK